jgi:hypothetical protein
MKKIPPYFKQQNSYTCSLAVLRMVLKFYGNSVSEEELVKKVEVDYGKDFKNLWNPTIAKLSRDYGINTTMYAAWPLFKKEIYPLALADYIKNPTTMDYKKYENSKDKDELTEPLPLSYKEMFKALELGCECVYGKLTSTRIKTLLSKDYLIQTSVKLHLLYPGKKQVFHSILIYKIDGDILSYHDPAYGENLTCTLIDMVRAANDVGAAIVYHS